MYVRTCLLLACLVSIAALILQSVDGQSRSRSLTRRKLPARGISATESSAINVNMSYLNLPKTGRIEMSIMYNSTNPDSLLWWYEDSQQCEAMYFSNGQLVILVNYASTTGEKSQRVTISLDQQGYGVSSFTDGVPIELTLIVESNQLDVFIGSIRLKSVNFKKGLRFFGDGSVRVGNADGIASLSEINVGNYVGIMYSFIIRVAGLAEVDIVEWIIERRGGIVVGGEVATYDVQESQSSQNVPTDKLLPGMIKSPIRFLGSGGVARVSAYPGDRYYWDFDIDLQTRSEMDFEFLTYDPIGVLMFKGAQIQSIAYFCVEIFDGYLYFKVNFGTGVDHEISRLCNGTKVNDGNPHMVNLTIERKWEEVVINGARQVSDKYVTIYATCDGFASEPLHQPFSDAAEGYLYVGGIDSVSRLPWHVWSRRNYNGGFLFFRFNKLYVDFNSIFQMDSTGVVLDTSHMENTCSSLDPTVDICSQNAGGMCWVDRGPISNGLRYFCDCADLAANALDCTNDFAIFNSGYLHRAWGVTLRPTWTTHCDDITMSFRYTPPEVEDDQALLRTEVVLIDDSDYGDWETGLNGLSDKGPTMFAISNERKDKHISVRLVDGNIELDMIFSGEAVLNSKQHLIRTNGTNFSDSEWHIIRILRRGEWLRVMIDKQQVFELFSSEFNFQMEVSHIYVGCLPDAKKPTICDQRTVFEGQLRNVIVNRLDVLYSVLRNRFRGYQTVSIVSVYKAYRSDHTILVQPIYTNPNHTDDHGDVDPGSSSVIEDALSKNTTVTDTIGLFGHPQSLIELRAPDFIETPTDLIAITFKIQTQLPDALILYMRSDKPIEGRNTSYITLEVVQTQLRILVELFGDFVIELENGTRVTKRSSVSFAKIIEGVEIADGHFHRVSLTVFLRNMELRIDNVDASIYYEESDPDASEKSLVALPDELLNGRIFLGGFDSQQSWRMARALGHTTIYDRYLRGCYSNLIVHTKPINFPYLKRYNLENRFKWLISPNCESLVMSCSSITCSNGGVCVQPQGASVQCDCSGTGFRGYYCDEEPQYGYYCGRGAVKAGAYVADGYVKRPPSTGDNDTLSFGVVTWYSSGTLLRMEHQTTPKQIYLELSLYNGALMVEYRNNLVGYNDTIYSPPTIKLNQGNYQIVRLNRTYDTLTVSVRSALADSEERWSTKRRLRGFEMFASGKFQISLCGRPRHTITNYFNGIIAALGWGGADVFEAARASSIHELRGDVLQVEKPFMLVPWPCYSIFSSTPCPSVTETFRPLPTLGPTTGGNDNGRTGTIGGGGGMAMDWLQPQFDAVAEVASDSFLSVSALIAICVISGMLMAGSAIWWLISNMRNGFMIVPGPPPAAAAAVPPPEPDDIGTQSTTNVRSAPPPANDIPSTTSAIVRSAPPPAPAVHGGVGMYAQFGGVQYWPVPVPVPVPVAMPVPMSIPYMYPTGYALPLMSQTHAPPALPHYQPALSETSFLTVDRHTTAGNGGRLALEYRPTVAENVKMHFGGTETITETRHNSVQQLASTRSLNETAANFEIPDEYKVNCFTMTGDGRFVITGSSCGPPSVFSLNSGQLVRAFEDATDSVTASDELQLACRDELLVGQIAFLTGANVSEIPLGLRRLQIWRVNDGSVMPMSSYLYCTASCLLRNRQYVVAGAIDGAQGRLSACLWNLIANEPTAQLNALLGNEVRSESFEVRQIKVGTDDDCCIVALSGSAAAPTQDTIFYVWNFYEATDETPLRFIRFGAKPECFVLLPDRLCIVGTHSGELFLWNTQTMNLTDQFHVGLKTVLHAAVTVVDISLDYAFVATGDARGNVKIWQFNNTAVGEAPGLLHALDAVHRGPVTSFSIAIDNELLISGSTDGSIRLWKIADGTQLCWFESNMDIIQVRMTNNKRAIVALGERGDCRKLAMLRVVRNVITRKRTSPEEIIESSPSSELSD